MDKCNICELYVEDNIDVCQCRYSALIELKNSVEELLPKLEKIEKLVMTLSSKYGRTLDYTMYSIKLAEMKKKLEALA